MVVKSAGGISGNAAATVMDTTAPLPRSNFLDSALRYAVDRDRYMEEQDGNLDRIRMAQARSVYERRANEALSGLNPLDPGYAVEVERSLSALEEEVASDVELLRPDQNAPVLGESLRLWRENLTTSAMARRQGVIEAEGVRQEGVLRAETLQSITSDPEGALTYLDSYTKGLDSLGTAVPPYMRPALAKQFQRQAVDAVVSGYTEQGGFAEARAYLDAPEIRQIITPAEYRTLKNRITNDENVAKQVNMARTEEEVTQLEYASNNAQTVEEAQAALDTLQELRGRGVFEGRSGQGRNIRQRLEAVIKTVRVKETQVGGIAAKVYGGGALDPKEVETAWDVYRTAELNALPEEQRNSPDAILGVTARFVNLTGMVPEGIQRQIGKAELVDDIPAINQAVVLHNAIAAENPFADTGAGPRTLAIVAAAEAFGMSVPEAVAFMKPKLEEADQAKLDAEFEDAYADLGGAGIFSTVVAYANPASYLMYPVVGRINPYLSGEDAVRRHLGDTIGADPEPGLLGGSAAPIGDDVVAEYKATLKQFYSVTGDMNIARAATDKRFQATYGRSEVSGSPKTTRYPPERHVNLPDLNYDDRTKVIRAQVQAVYPGVGLDFDLRSTPTTAGQIARGEKPQYEIWVKNDLGLSVRVLETTLNGQQTPALFTLPNTNDLRAWGNRAYLDIENERLRALDGGRALAEVMERDPEGLDVSIQVDVLQGIRQDRAARRENYERQQELLRAKAKEGEQQQNQGRSKALEAAIRAVAARR